MIKKLINGDYGLAKTFWLGGVLVSAILSPLMINLSRFPHEVNEFLRREFNDFLPHGIGDETLLTLALLSLAAFGAIYFSTIAWSIWSAANKYSGWDGWALAAKVYVVLVILNTVLVVLSTGFATLSGI